MFWKVSWWFWIIHVFLQELFCFHIEPLSSVHKVSTPVERRASWCLQAFGIVFVSFSAFGFLSVFGFRLMSPGKDATEEFDMLHDRKVIKKYGIDEGTVVLKGTLSKWMWQMRPAMVATFAMRPQVILALLITGRPVRSLLEEAADRVRCSWSEDPGDPSIKKGKTWEMSFSTFAQLCWTLRFQWHIASESFILDNFFCKFFLHGFFSMTYYSRTMACEGVWKKSVGNVVVKRVQFC